MRGKRERYGVLAQNDDFHFIEGAQVEGIEYEVFRWIHWAESTHTYQRERERVRVCVVPFTFFFF
jgi:hypothetical protein